MGRVRFPVPADERELIDLLTAAGDSFCLFEKDGTGYGWLAEELRQAGRGAEPSPFFEVYDGDQCMLQAEGREEALAFLQGVFLMAFSGQSLENIRRKAEEVKTLDGYMAWQEMHKFRER